MENLMNVIPNTSAEAENLINQFRLDASPEKEWNFDGESKKQEQNQAPKDKTKTPEVIAPTPSGLELEIDGKKLKFSDEDARRYAMEGYKATQKYEQILSEQKKIAEEKANLDRNIGKYDYYQKIDEWAKQNPELYNRLALEYENQQSGGALGDVPPYLAKFVSELNSMKEKFSEIDKIKQQQLTKAQDETLNKEIDSFKQQHPQFDWNDKTLEQKIITHAVENKLSSFRAAARDLLFDDLVKRSELKAKETIGKEIQKNTKLGEIQKRSESPINQTQKPFSTKNKSWDQLAKEALSHFGA